MTVIGKFSSFDSGKKKALCTFVTGSDNDDGSDASGGQKRHHDNFIHT